jgi:hypothetical protein
VNADRRLTPARPDLAARHLAGTVEAARFVDAAPCRVTAASAPMRAAPDPAAPFDTELLHGEEIAIYEIAGPWAWGQSALDGYVGYVPAPSVACTEAPAPTHRVATLWANLYPRPALKSPPFAALPFAARVAVGDERDGLALIAPETWVFLRHLAPLDRPLDEPVPDWVAVAERLVGAPYLWGGRSPAGLDCSALLQLARQAAGHACPRDSDMQAALGWPLAPDEALHRGDLVFWRGHVAIMLDGARIVHSNGHHMATVVEPLAEAVARIEAAGGGPVTRRARLDEPAPAV